MESAYWDRVPNDAVELLRITHEKQVCLDLVKDHVPDAVSADGFKPKSVVEIGIGALGVGVCSLLDHSEAWTRVGVEPQPPRELGLSGSLGAAFRLIQQIPVSYVRAMGEDTGLRSDFFDLAICYNVLDHTLNWRGILREVWRVLKPGGYFILGVDALCVLNKLRWAWWQRRVWKTDPYIVAHPYRFTAFELEHLLPRCGFDLVWMQKSPSEMRRRILGRARRLTLVGLKRPKIVNGAVGR